VTGSLFVLFICCVQGLIVQADAVSTPYSYEACTMLVVTPQFTTVCLSRELTEVESAPVIPPFTYNNQCSSVLLTAYIPVLIIGFSIQLILCFIMPGVLFQVGKLLSLANIIHRKITKGVLLPNILWPKFWSNCDDSDLASPYKDILEKDPTIILNSPRFLCFNVLNNVVIMLTFGLCSPILAVAVTCVVVSKSNVLMLLVGRFTAVLSSEDSKSMHFALVALTKLPFPLNEVLQQSFWLIVWTSALFVLLVCWDLASDDVGWVASLWIPIAVICYPLSLWTAAFYVRHRHYPLNGLNVAANRDVELAAASSSTSSSPPQNSDAINKNPMHLQSY
jgi:hypothetical protein